MSKYPKVTEKDLVKRETPVSINKIIGLKFGRLLVVEYAGERRRNDSQTQYLWCQCDCGKKWLAAANHLKNGRLRSCGCFVVDNPNRRVHGYAPLVGKREKIYHAWKGMHTRTKGKPNDTTRKYIEKGIVVCEGWSGKNGFLNFKADMEPVTNKSLDRIDNDKHYSCGRCKQCIRNGWKLNCRWSDDNTQSNNRSGFNNWMILDGIKMTYRQASRYIGFNQKSLQCRIKTCGWDELKAITTPLNGVVPKKVKYKPFNG